MSYGLLFCLVLISLLAAVTSICPNGYTKWDDECYRRYETKQSFLDAANLCREFGGHLATLNTATKISNAKTFLKDVDHKVNVWVGANDLRTESVWKWDIDQKNFTVTDWYTGEPDGNTNENCLILLHSRDFKWADAPCSNKYDYLCEIKSIPA